MLEVVPGRTTAACQALWQGLGAQQGQSVEAVALDMWEPFLKATTAAAPQAEIVHDKFHVSMCTSPAKTDTRFSVFLGVGGWGLEGLCPSNSPGFFALGLHRQGPAGRPKAAPPAVCKATPALEARPRIALSSEAA